MKALIIDISSSSFRDYMHLYGRAVGVLYGIWYRVARPLMVTCIWVLFSLYVYHSLVTVGGTAAQVAQLLAYVVVVAGIAAALVAWLTVCRFYDWIRAQDRAKLGPRPVEAALEARWIPPPEMRQVIVAHDGEGNILSVAPKVAGDPVQPPPPVPSGKGERIEPTLAAIA